MAGAWSEEVVHRAACDCHCAASASLFCHLAGLAARAGRHIHGAAFRRGDRLHRAYSHQEAAAGGKTGIRSGGSHRTHRPYCGHGAGRLEISAEISVKEQIVFDKACIS